MMEMSEIWIFTAPAKKGSLSFMRNIFQGLDGKRYQMGIEIGRKGYRHVQGRMEISGCSSIQIPTGETKRNGQPKLKESSFIFEQCRSNGVHAEKSEQWCEYENKDGFYISSEDNEEIRKQRFGKPTAIQEDVINLLEWTNDREILVWHSEDGGVGKSWLTGHLWEKGKAHYIRMTGVTAETMVKDTASKMSAQRRPIVIIDVPRATTWKKPLYEAIEVIKDGLIDDPRYKSNALNIRGTKVLVMCNTKPNLDKLSEDRWIIYGQNIPKALQEARLNPRPRAQGDIPT